MSSARPWIAYVGPVPFPAGGAAARRILGNARALVASGYDVTIVSGQAIGPSGPVLEVERGIRCVSVNERDVEHLPRALRRARYSLMGIRTRRWLERQEPAPSAVILYSGYTPYLLQLGFWARRAGVALLFDAVEWYTADTVAGFLVSPYLWNTEFAMRVLVPRADGVIAISRALQSYYDSRGVSTVRVPPLFDPAEVRASVPREGRSGQLRLAYAGSPGTKDQLDMVVDAVEALYRRGVPVVLDVVGVTEGELLRGRSMAGGKCSLPACLHAHGKVTHERALQVVSQADFTVFLRRNNRVSRHGFPTKFVESLAAGTPVITNLTSDLMDHLRDGENGLICGSPASQALEKTLERALVLDSSHYRMMRVAARAEAESSFAFRGYSEALKDLINRAQQARKAGG